MGQIQSTVGLFSGINIGSLVDQLIAIDSEPVTKLQNQDTTLQTQEQGISQLTTLLSSVQSSAKALEQSTVFTAATATTSDASLSAAVTGTPQTGTYEYTPVQVAQSQQWLSGGFDSESTPIGGGQLSFGFGEGVSPDTPLANLNGGAGVPPGEIRITDKSGASAVIDLSTAQTVDDVLNLINSNTTIQVHAAAQGDGIQLTDESGGTATLSVTNVGNSTTAAALGLTSLDASGDGSPIVYLSNSLTLNVLNDGNGITTNPTGTSTSAALPDIHYQLSNGDHGDISLATAKTVGNVIQDINAADPGNLVASIDGTRLVVTDKSGGTSNSFSLTSEYGSQALQDLGLDGTPDGGTITGRALLAGPQDVLLSSLNGGQGLGTLGEIDITNRSSSTPVTVDLAGAETLGDVVDLINEAGAGVTAQINAANDGIELTDTSGGSGNLVVADTPGQTADTAEALGIAVNGAVSSVNSDLHLQTVSANTLLSTYNGGAGVAPGTLTIIDSNGNQSTVDLSSSSIQTIGDVIRAMNNSCKNVTASINAEGDGIALTETNPGSGQLTVEEGDSTTAADLHLLNQKAVTSTDQGVTTQTIDGSSTYTVQWDNTATLSDVLGQIQALNAGVNAQIIGDGADSPFQLSLSSKQSGTAGAMVMDASQANFTLNQVVSPQNALLRMGGGVSAGSGALITSSSNTFNNVLTGASLTINQPSDEPVQVTVAQSDSSLVSTVQTLVDGYNTFHSTLQQLTAYNTTTNTGSALTDDPAALNLDMGLSNLLSGSFGSGSVTSPADVGITVNSDGTLSLNQTVLQQEFAADPTAVQDFFTTAKTGFATKLDQTIQQLAGTQNSVLADRLQALQDTVTQNQAQITQLNQHLANEQQDMLNEFYQMELAIEKMQSNSSIITAMMDSLSGTSDTTSSTSTSNPSVGNSEPTVAGGTSNSSSGSTASTASTTA